MYAGAAAGSRHRGEALGQSGEVFERLKALAHRHRERGAQLRAAAALPGRGFPVGFNGSIHLLLRYAFDSVGTESRILFANFPEFLELLRIAPGLKFFDAVPGLHDDAPFWRLSLEHSDLSSLSKGAPARCLGPGRSARDVLLRVSRRVRYVDLHDVVDGRLGLGVKAFDRCGAESETGDDRQRRVLSFHACILPVQLRDRKARGDYLTRFQTRSARPPPEAAALVYFSSSPETVNGRLWAVPSQLG